MSLAALTIFARLAGTRILSATVLLAFAWKIVRWVGIANSVFAVSVLATYLLFQAGHTGAAGRTALVGGTVMTYWAMKYLAVRTFGSSSSKRKCR